MAEQESAYLWSTTALTNGTADPAINFAEGQLPSTVNNSARALMTAMARYIKDTDGSLTTAGSANAYTLTINGRQTPLATGHILTFKASFAITGTATLAVTNADAVALGTKAIRAPGDVALGTGQMISGAVYTARYDTAANSAAGAWLLLNPTDPRTNAASGLTLYVRTDGVDTNDGLANTAGGAKLTLQAAWNDACRKYDFRGGALDITVADGTYALGIITEGEWPMGATTVRINGNATTPANCFLSSTTDDVFRLYGVSGVPIQVKGFKLKSTAGNLINVSNGTVLYLTDKMEYNSASTAHIQVQNGASLVQFANYTINGNAGSDHNHIINGANYGGDGITVTLSGTPSFGGAFMGAAGNSFASYTSGVYSGSGTGTRYNIHGNSFVKTAAATPSTFFPGNVAGTSDGGNLDDDCMGGAWIAFSPTPTPGGGAMTASSSGGYKKVGGSGSKMIAFRLAITITAAGTGTGVITVALPSGVSNGQSVALAVDTNVTGHMGRGLIANGATSMTLLEYDGSTTMIHTGSVIGVSGTYETT